MNPYVILNNTQLTPEQEEGSINYSLALMETGKNLRWYLRDAIGETVTEVSPPKHHLDEELIRFYDGRLWCEINE